MNPAFPDGYSNWQETDLHELIDAELIKEPTDKNVVQGGPQGGQGRRRDRDRDRLRPRGRADRPRGARADRRGEPAVAEGEHRRRGRRVKRARYSALTKEEIERAFGDLDDLSYDLAYAGAARQDIDLIWGATLTRAVSLATRRFGSNFLSVGRVQSPTLALIVERELERRAHVAKPYWELFARFAHPDGAFEAHHATDKFWEKAEAEAALAGTKSPGRRQGGQPRSATRASRRRPTTRPRSPPTRPSRLGITPSAAMRIAEDLYMDGFISYPRTDNTVYPRSLNTRELVSSLVRIPDFDAAAPLLDSGAHPDPRQEGDHRPPADLPDAGGLPERARRVQAPRLRARRPAFPRHLLPADDHRVHPRRHRGRRGELLRPRVGRGRPRIRRDLHLRTLEPTTRSRSSKRARSWRSTASRGWSTRRPSRRRGSARASWSR